jgi:Dolichyl-phosphate-mannose-protein mannosyltransferase
MKRLLLKEKYIALACVLLFVGLIFASVMRPSVWHDEGYTAVLVENSYGGIIERTALDVHPPLYYLALKTWSLATGDSVLALRLYSAVCMLGAIIITWRIVRKLYGVKAGVIALACMAVGPFLVRYGQEMRMYGQAALLASAATYLYIQTLKKKVITFPLALAYGAVIGAGMLTQYFFILVPLIHVLHAYMQQKGSAAQRVRSALQLYTTSIAAAVLLFVPWLPKVYDQFTDVYGAFWIGPVSIETLTSTPVAMTAFKKQFQMTGVEGLLAVVTLVLLFVVYKKFYKKHTDITSRLLLLSVTLPPLMLFLLSVPPFQPSYQDRYMSFMAPLFYSIIGLGILAFTKTKVRLSLALFFMLLLGYGQWNNYWNGNNHGWSPNPTFTMNKIIDQINNDAPVYSTSLWTYLDARTTLRDRGSAQTGLLLLQDVPTTFKGNWSVIYKRPELYATSIPSNVRSFWLIDESGSAKYGGTALQGYVPGITYQSGYATITEYTKN